MSVIKNIISFFKKIFKKEDNIKMLDVPVETTMDAGKINFINSLKIDIVKKKKKVETLICDGDGLGIQTKISF